MPYKVNKSYNESVLTTKRDERNEEINNNKQYEQFINVELQSSNDERYNVNDEDYQINQENNFDVMMKKSMDEFNSKQLENNNLHNKNEDLLKSDDEFKSNSLCLKNFTYIETGNSYKDLYQTQNMNQTQDPFLSLTIEKVK
jgi:hypothetical protein